MFSKHPVAIPITEPPPRTPTVDDVFTEAAHTTSYATSVLPSVIEELMEANARFDDVEMRATAEIERLTALRRDATSKRRANCAVIEALQALSALPTGEQPALT
jgi:hypothetical protein